VDLQQAVRDAADTSAITQLILKERESRDLGRWEDMRDVLTPIRRSASAGFAATAPTSSRDRSTWRAATCSPSTGSRPFASCSRGERAVATMSAVIEIPVELKGGAMNLLSYTRFVYRAERREGTYFQLRRDLSARRTHARHSGHSIAIDPDELRPFRPTYRLLSYVLSKQGYAIDSELAGEDRPDSVGALMRGIFAWAGIGQGLGGDEVRLSCERRRYGARALSVKPRGCFGVRVIADYWL
jgi:hypothetical protein